MPEWSRFLEIFPPIRRCGRELLARALEYARHGYRYRDFLRGEEPYKFDSGADTVAKCRLILERSLTVDHAVRAEFREAGYGEQD